MLNEILTWTQIAAYLVFGWVAARKNKDTHDPGLLWVVLGFTIPAAIIVMAQAWGLLVVWPRSPHQTQLIAAFDSVRTIAQVLGLTVGIYMLGGRPQERNPFKWLSNDDIQPGSSAPRSSV
jgi:hypothetical protein